MGLLEARADGNIHDKKINKRYNRTSTSTNTLTLTFKYNTDLVFGDLEIADEEV